MSNRYTQDCQLVGNFEVGNLMLSLLNTIYWRAKTNYANYFSKIISVKCRIWNIAVYCKPKCFICLLICYESIDGDFPSKLRAFVRQSAFNWRKKLFCDTLPGHFTTCLRVKVKDSGDSVSQPGPATATALAQHLLHLHKCNE